MPSQGPPRRDYYIPKPCLRRPRSGRLLCGRYKIFPSLLFVVTFHTKKSNLFL